MEMGPPAEFIGGEYALISPQHPVSQLEGRVYASHYFFLRVTEMHYKVQVASD
jgi:hypothetical protein